LIITDRIDTEAEAKTPKKLDAVIAAEKNSAEQVARYRQGGAVFPEMDDQKDFWILDPKVDRNDCSEFFRGAAFVVALSLPIWCLVAWLVL
jgi:hypothetical protein